MHHFYNTMCILNTIYKSTTKTMFSSLLILIIITQWIHCEDICSVIASMAKSEEIHVYNHRSVLENEYKYQLMMYSATKEWMFWLKPNGSVTYDHQINSKKMVYTH